MNGPAVGEMSTWTPRGRNQSQVLSSQCIVEKFNSERKDALSLQAQSWEVGCWGQAAVGFFTQRHQRTTSSPPGRFRKGKNEHNGPNTTCQETKGIKRLMSIFISYFTSPPWFREGFKAAWFMLRKAVLIKPSHSRAGGNAWKPLMTRVWHADGSQVPGTLGAGVYAFTTGRKKKTTNDYYSSKAVFQ